MRTVLKNIKYVRNIKKMRYLENDAFPEILLKKKDICFFFFK